MAVHVVLGEGEVRSILAEYALGEVEAFAGIPEGSINTAYWVLVSGRRLFLRISESKTEEDLEFEEAILDRLSSAGLPASRLVRRKDGRTFAQWAPGKLISVFEHMGGAEVSRVRPAHVREVASFAGRMHLALLGFDRVRANEFRLENLLSKMAVLEAAVRDGRLDGRFRSDLDVLHAELGRQSRRDLAMVERHTVHGDLFIDNAKFEGDHLVGIFDFEMASTERATWELAVLINAWCFDEERGAFDLDLVGAAREGYERERRLDERERSELTLDLRLAAARFAVTRLYDFELNPLPEGRRVYKDYRAFLRRLARCIDI